MTPLATGISASVAPTLRLSGIVEESVVDGPGIRCVVFVQGCPHGCPGCHSPQTHAFDGGYEADVTAVTDLVKGNPLIAGVTFSGGEPMCQAAALFCVASRVKEAGLGIALYTGYTLESLLTENDRDRIRLLELCDVLVDGRYEEDKRYPAQAFKGSSNQRVLDVQQSLGKRRAILAAAPEWGNAMA